MLTPTHIEEAQVVPVVKEVRLVHDYGIVKTSQVLLCSTEVNIFIRVMVGTAVHILLLDFNYCCVTVVC